MHTAWLAWEKCVVREPRSGERLQPRVSEDELCESNVTRGLRERPNRRRAGDLQTFGITPSRNRLECRHDPTTPIRLSIASAESVVATSASIREVVNRLLVAQRRCTIIPGLRSACKASQRSPGATSFRQLRGFGNDPSLAAIV